MTTKAAIIATGIVFLVGLISTVVLLVLFVHPSSRNALERAEQMGQGVGMFCLFPLFIIWIMWADRTRKERERNSK